MNELIAQPKQAAVPTAPDALLAVDDGLRHSLGGQADASVALVNDLLDVAPTNVAKALLQSGIFRNAEVVAWVASLLQSQEVVAADGLTVEREIAMIQHILRTDRQRYNKDLAMQARFQTLLASR